MKFPVRPTLGGIAAALTIPKLLPDAASFVASAVSISASKTWEYVGSPLFDKGCQLAGFGWNFTAAKAAWTAESTLNLLRTPTGETLLGYDINIGTILAAAVLTGTAAGLAMSHIENQYKQK